MSDVSPHFVLEQVAQAIPKGCHKNIIIVGSLAAGYILLPKKFAQAVRTKDVDCVLFPRIEAVESGRAVAEVLLAHGWRLRTEDAHGKPGTSFTADVDLPAIRLYPPNSTDWFIEFLTLPRSEEDTAKEWTRVVVNAGPAPGHYGIPSFRFLSLATFDPIQTDLGIACARPEMMALANLLENPTIRKERMSGPIEGRQIKRSNKDLGRVLAIAELTTEQEIIRWPDKWLHALQVCFPSHWRFFASTTGSGIRQLLKSDEDLEEAWYTCVNGLLAAGELHRTMEQLRLTGERLLQDAVVPLEQRAHAISI